MSLLNHADIHQTKVATLYLFLAATVLLTVGLWLFEKRVEI